MKKFLIPITLLSLIFLFGCVAHKKAMFDPTQPSEDYEQMISMSPDNYGMHTPGYAELLMKLATQTLDSKVTALSAITDIQATDVFYIVDDPGGTPASKKITAINVFDLIDTSAELASILTNETGTGVAVFATSPTLVTPVLGTIASGVGTALTALNGENIQDDTIDDDSIDFSDVTLNDFTFDVGSVSKTEYGYLNGVTSSIQEQLDSGGGRFSQGLTAVAFTGSDATPDVNNDGTDVVQYWQTADTTTITDLDDGTADVGGDTTANHSSFSDGDTVFIQCLHAAVFDFSDNANLKGHGNNNYTCGAGEWVLCVFDDTNDYWVCKPSETKTANFSAFQLPHSSSGDATLATEAGIQQKSDEDAIAVHGGSSGEVQGEAVISMIEHIYNGTLRWPDSYYDQESTYRVLPIMYVGDDMPHGFTLTEWKVNYVGGDPTTELDADIMCDTTPDFNPAADATVMDAIDTTAGASSADTGFDSATCANGSRMYIRFGADPTDANEVIAIDIWGYAEED